MCLLSCFLVDKCEGQGDKNISLHSSKFDKSQNSSPNLRMLEFNLKEHKEDRVHSFNTHPQQTKADPNKESAVVLL